MQYVDNKGMNWTTDVAIAVYGVGLNYKATRMPDTSAMISRLSIQLLKDLCKWYGTTFTEVKTWKNERFFYHLFKFFFVFNVTVLFCMYCCYKIRKLSQWYWDPKRIYKNRVVRFCAFKQCIVCEVKHKLLLYISIWLFLHMAYISYMSILKYPYLYRYNDFNHITQTYLKHLFASSGQAFYRFYLVQ